MRATTLGLALLALASPALAQSAAPVETKPNTPSVDCRAQAQSKSLKGQEMRDAIALCVAEQRVTCLKEAIDRKIIGSARQTFLKTCAGRPKT